MDGAPSLPGPLVALDGVYVPTKKGDLSFRPVTPHTGDVEHADAARAVFEVRPNPGSVRSSNPIRVGQVVLRASQ